MTDVTGAFIRDVCAQMRPRVRQLARYLHPTRDTGHMQLPDISVMRHGKCEEKRMTMDTKPRLRGLAALITRLADDTRGMADDEATAVIDQRLSERGYGGSGLPRVRDLVLGRRALLLRA